MSGCTLYLEKWLVQASHLVVVSGLTPARAILAVKIGTWFLELGNKRWILTSAHHHLLQEFLTRERNGVESDF